GTAISLGDATTSTSGTVVTITPKSAGTISVAYRVNDKLKDPSRVVQGTITVVVTGPPDAPTGVVARAKGPTGATVSFNAPASNGERITEYLIFDSNRKVASCTETVCEVNGLTTGRSYTFTVKAVNASGPSEGAESNAVTLSGVPDRPGSPTVTEGDGTLTVKWDAPNDNGSPITSYTVYATVAGSAPTTCTTSVERTCIIKSLVNDRKYTVTVVATNANGSSQASPGETGTPKAEAPDTPSITRGKVRNALDDRLEITLTWNYFKSGGTGWGSTTVTVNGSTKTVSGGVNNEMNGTGTTTMIVDSADELTATVTVSNVEGRTATSAPKSFSPILKPPTPDAPGLHAPRDNSSGVISVSNARLREGSGFKVADLELFYANSAAGCTAPGNPVAFNNGDRADFDIGPLDPGSTVTYYFCQRGKKGDGSYAWSGTVAVTGVVGTGQRSRDDDDNSPIPTFEVQAAASYVQKNRSWGVAASWSNPSGVEITQTNTWIEGLKDSTKQSWSGPLNNWWAEDLAPGHEYTIVVELIGKKGQHREVKTTVKTGDLADNVKATFEGAVTCPNGQPCGSMTLRAVNAPNYSSGVILVCRVKTGRPSAITEFRFSRDNPQITGILTEATTGEELLAKPPVVDCRAE
ncbi:MAG: fibronectin type III domain-containing protein, partial [Thermobifida sp.]|nr:fibronectin type III domain-containing protein [Thermobifida sp.]